MEITRFRVFKWAVSKEPGALRNISLNTLGVQCDFGYIAFSRAFSSLRPVIQEPRYQSLLNLDTM